MEQEEHARRTIEGIPRWKWVLINVAAVLVGLLMYPAAYGVVTGVFVAGPIAKGEMGAFEMILEKLPPEQREAIEEGIFDPDVIEELLEDLEVREEIHELLKEQAKNVNWILVLPAMSFLVFALLGFVVGLLRLLRYVVIIPVILLFVSWPILNSDQFELVQDHRLTVFLSIAAQFLAIYLFAWFGRSLRKPR